MGVLTDPLQLSGSLQIIIDGYTHNEQENKIGLHRLANKSNIINRKSKMDLATAQNY